MSQKRVCSSLIISLGTMVLAPTPASAEPKDTCPNAVRSLNFMDGYDAYQERDWELVIELMTAELVGRFDAAKKYRPRPDCEGAEAVVPSAMGTVPYVPSYYIAIARCNLEKCRECLLDPVRRMEAPTTRVEAATILALCPDRNDKEKWPYPDWANERQRKPEQLCKTKCVEAKCVQCEMPSPEASGSGS